MDAAQQDPDAYLEAFMHGFEFVLLAMRGRLAEEHVPREERERLEAFLADYFRIANAYRARESKAAAKDGVAALQTRAFKLDVTGVAAN